LADSTLRGRCAGVFRRATTRIGAIMQRQEEKIFFIHRASRVIVSRRNYQRTVLENLLPHLSSLRHEEYLHGV